MPWLWRILLLYDLFWCFFALFRVISVSFQLFEIECWGGRPKLDPGPKSGKSKEKSKIVTLFSTVERKALQLFSVESSETQQKGQSY